MNATELLDAARNALAIGNHDGGIDTACLAHARATDDDETRTRAAVLVARGLVGKELFSDAIGWCDQALAAAPGSAEALAYRGWSHLHLGRVEEAQLDLDRAAAEPAPALAHYFRAVALRRAGRPDEAYPAITRVVDDAERGAGALRQRGLWRLVDGDRAAALTDLAAAASRGDATAAVKLHDEDALPDDSESQLTWAGAVADQDPESAIMLLEQMIASDLPAPVRARVHARRGLLANWQSQMVLAADHYVRAAELTPDDPELLIQLGRALYNADRDEEGRGVLERALTLGARGGTAEGFLGDIHFVAHRNEEAVACYQRALALSPRNAGIMARCASALSNLDRDDEASELRLDAAIAGDLSAIELCDQLGIELPQTLFDAGGTGLQYGGEPMAIASGLRRAAELWLARSRAPGDFGARHAAMALSNQAYALGLAGQREDAVAAGRRAVELRPGFRDGWNNLGNQLAAAGQLAEAVAAFERCAWCDPGFAGAPYGMADALRKLGRADEAVVALERAAAIGYQDPKRQSDIHFRLARGMQALGRWAEASTQYAHMARLTGSEDDVAMAAAVDRIAELAAAGPSALTPAPYRRYGLRPERWAQTRELACRLQLATEPDEPTRAAIARAALLAVNQRGAELEGSLWWSDRFVVAVITPEEASDLPERAVGALEALVDAVHAVAPLREAVGLSAVGLSVGDPGESWSIATQPVPDPGPEYPRHVGFWIGGVIDVAGFAPLAPAAAAEAAMHQVRTDIARRDADAWIGDARARQERGEIVIIPVEGEPPTPPGHGLGDRVGPDDYARTAGGAGVILRRHDGYYPGVDRITASGEVATVLPVDSATPLLLRHVDAVSVSPDGRWALYATALQRELWRLEIATGATVKLAELPRKVVATAFFASGELMVRTEAALRIYRMTGDEVELIGRASTELGTATVVGGGRIIVIGQLEAPQVVVYGWSDGVLARLARITAPINCYTIGTVDGRVFARTELPVEIVNLEASWERFAAWRRERTAAHAALTGLVVEEISGGPSPGIQEGPAALRDEVSWLVTGPAGLSFALASDDDDGYRAVAGDEDGPHELEPPIAAPSFVYDWRPDGKAVLAVANGALHEIDLVARTTRPLGEGVDRACYTRDGYAAAEGTELVLYRWAAGGDAEPVELGRLAVDEDLEELGWTAEGAALVVVVDGHTSILAIDGGVMRPLGSVELDGWYCIWNLDGVTYLQLSYEGAPRPIHQFRLIGVAAAIAAAAAATPIDELITDELPVATLWQMGLYPAETTWSTGPVVEEEDDLDDDDDDDDEDDDDDDDDLDDFDDGDDDDLDADSDDE